MNNSRGNRKNIFQKVMMKIQDCDDRNNCSPLFADSSGIPASEKQYYQPDEYYTYIVFQGTPFETHVVEFETRKKKSPPSKTGLYVPEILMLSFCSKYPNPKDGYPGYWWFTYGVRDVGEILQRLETGGYIEINPETEKYRLTSLGKQEEEDNAFIAFTHRNSPYRDFTPWEMNDLVHKNPKKSWIDIYCQKTGASKELVVSALHRHKSPIKTKKEISSLTPQPIKKRIPISKIKNKNDWDTGYKKGSPHFIKGEEYRKNGEIYKAIDEYDLAREYGYRAPALYKGYAMAFRKIKEYEHEVDILLEGIERCNDPGMSNGQRELIERLGKAQTLLAKQKEALN